MGRRVIVFSVVAERNGEWYDQPWRRLLALESIARRRAASWVTALVGRPEWTGQP